MNDASNPIEVMEKLTDKNLWLWRLNETTDPGRTKPVKFGRSFTAIDAYYQIKRATETFGPCGDRWGWDLEESVVNVQTKDGEIAFAKCKVSLWYYAPGSAKLCRMGPVVGVNQLVSKAGQADDDAFKKATTDAITKALSYLGFSADVFMGLFDDNKYVDRLRKEFDQKAEATGSKLPETVTKALAQLPKQRDVQDLAVLWRTITKDLEQLRPAEFDFVKNRFAMRKQQLAPVREDDQGGPPQLVDPVND